MLINFRFQTSIMVGYATWSLAIGLSYLQALCLYSLMVIDLPTQSGIPSDVTKAIAHYKTHRISAGYKLVTLACIMLGLGVFGNVWNRRGDLLSLAMLVITSVIFHNNQNNVVGATRFLETGCKGREELYLMKVLLGHAANVFGFVLLTMGVVFS